MNTITTKPGDHSKEIRRSHQQLMPVELKDKREKRLSENEFARRNRARSEVIHLLEKMEAKGLTIDKLTMMVDGLPDPGMRTRKAVQKGLQFPA
jgi:hypothetical protein